MHKRVVITGIGVVSSIGKNKREFCENLFKGNSGIVKQKFQYINGDACGSAGVVSLNEEEIHKFFKENNLPYDKASQLALMAAEECIEQSSIKEFQVERYRQGVAVGTSLGGMLSGDKFHVQWLEQGIEKADKELLRQYPLHAIADIIAKEFEFNGVKCIISTACAAGGNAIGYGADMIKSGKFDVMLAGGVDPLSRFSFAGFKSLKALDSDPCKPYSESKGINLGEGAAFFLLESFEHALKRNAKIIAEVMGYALSADAYHQTAPDLGGGGAVRSMLGSIKNSCSQKEEISYVNGHGTGTTSNDNAETKAFKSVFKEKYTEIPISSTKGGIGHCLGAAGAIEAVASVLAIENQKIPPTANFSKAKQVDVDFVPNHAKEKECNTVLSNSFAFGGNNCSVIFSKVRHDFKEKDIEKKPIVITGIGCTGVGGTNISELWSTFEKSECCIKEIAGFDNANLRCKWAGEMPKVDWKRFIPNNILRRADSVTKLAMASGKQALDDSKLKVTNQNNGSIGVIYATGTGPLETIEAINRSLVLKGIEAVNPFLFPNSVMNAAPGNFCIAHMIKGPTSTISSGGTSTLNALVYGCELLRSRQAEALVIIGADECNEVLIRGYDKIGLLSDNGVMPFSKKSKGMILSPGSTAFIIETEEHAKKRNAKIYAKILGYASTSDNSPLCYVSKQGIEWQKSVSLALEESRLDKVDHYASSASGVKGIDIAEANLINNLFTKETAISSVQSLLGFTSGSSGGYELLSNIYAMETGKIPSTPNKIQSPLDKIAGKINQEKARKKEIKNAAVSAVSFGGAYTTIIVGK
ncbi:beta-ketoacyl-[acyl-carrier-protein] synthase family protein [Herbivorax sp. ANBcel31]|uniref:beta-ketoacyl-[acyl-carrier-protein] synthase family protein n=1 Tax=Herbivorax sp. ANBcel31 TaxID=3069754 RepID=UPI0027AF9D6F|nr:beta-ketoacyl-[acyl-carrier-protein] synthase family protein [Herbivorax sp. ANBcel31]MDQ2085436.1 beta-ketoacyl-[acyl-carrier-protein] synthase family protein [Herbivorax sp. ANBcel31]